MVWLSAPVDSPSCAAALVKLPQSATATKARLWPIKFSKDGERDNEAWITARSAAKAAIDKWVKLVWVKRAYMTRDALPGYAPDPDFSKLPPFTDLVKLGFGEHGVIRDKSHPIYRELFGMPKPAAGRDDDASADL
jgi:hypothetical protein